MKPIDHKTAQQMIHARLDGALESAASARLDAHLQDCATCRRYADQTMKWNADLRRCFRAREPSPATLSAPAVQAIYDRVAKSRANMKKIHFLSLSEATSLVLLLLLLTGGLLLTLANPELRSSLVPLSRIQATATTAPTVTPTQPPTATPLPPWTKDSPASSPAEIVPLLQELAQKNIERWMAPGWVYSITSDVGKPGTMQMYSIETWARYSADPGACPETLTVVRDQPGSETIIQMQVSLEDGRSGDLLTLRRGEGEIAKYTQDCPPQPGSTTAGFLARRMSGDLTAAYKGSEGEKLETARAWYETLDGKTVLVVYTGFSTPNNMTPKTIETHWFDLHSGLEVQRDMVMMQANGDVTGEMFTGIKYEFLSELPPTTAGQVTSALAELKSLAANPVVAPTATPLAADAVSSLRDLAYTQDAPLTDGQKILAALAALRQEQVDFLAKPGWYLYGRSTPIEGEISNRYNLLHVLDDGQCEMYTYYLQLPEERIATNEFILADGTTGQTDIRKAVIEDVVPGDRPCSPAMLDSLISLDNEILFFADFAAGKINGEYKAWVETIKGRKVFVLSYDIHYLDPKPSTMDPDTRKFEVEDRSQEWKYFDLETGASLGNYYQVTLENGKTFGEMLIPSESPAYELKYLPTLPDKLLAAYEKAAQELRSLLKQGE